MDSGPIDAEWPGGCFGCGAHNSRGLRLRFEYAPGGCRLRCRLDPDLCGIEGIAHGGIVATLIDEASAWALIGQLGRFGMTRTLQIEYLRPVPTGAEVEARACIEAHDERSATVTAEIIDGAGRVLARARSVWALLDAARLAQRTGLDERHLARFLAAAAPHVHGA